jgi:hypothetical protein
MYQIINTDGLTVAFAEELRFIKQNSTNGAFVEATDGDAQGVAYGGTPYNLAGRPPLSGVAETINVVTLTAEEAEKAQAEAERVGTIAECKAYLAQTDYIALKLAEAVAAGDAAEIADLQNTYAKELAERKAARATINDLEAETEAAAETQGESAGE